MAKETHKNPTAGLSLEQVEDLLQETRAQLSHGYRLPYMQWFEDDFRGSECVEEMHPLERLMYRQLLAKAWATKDAPYLPIDDGKLYRLSDCPSPELWTQHKDTVLGMFYRSLKTGKVFHPRQMLDYVGQLIKVAANTKNGRGGGRPPKPKTETEPKSKPNENPDETERLSLGSETETQPKPIKNKNQIKNQNLELEPHQERDECEEEIPENGQESGVGARKQIEALCRSILGIAPEQYTNVWAQVRDWELAESSSGLVREFEEWAQESVNEEFRGKPVSVFLRSLTNPERVLQKTAAIDSTVVDLVRELVYLTDGVVAFNNKHKAGIARLIQDGNTPAEITAAFKEYKAKLNFEDQFQMKFAAKTFVETADQLVYTARRKKAEKETEACAVEAARERMEREAAEERERRAAVRKLDEESVEETLTAD